MTYERSGLTARQFFDAWRCSVGELSLVRNSPYMASYAAKNVQTFVAERHGADAATKAVAYYERLRRDIRGGA